MPGTSVWFADLFGSQWVAWHRQDADLAVEVLLREARHADVMAAVAALAAVRRVVPPDLHDQLTAAIRARSPLLPDWAKAAPAEPTRAWLAEDPWSMRQTWFVEFDEPGYVLMASVVHAGGSVLDTLAVVQPEALTYYDDEAAEDEVPTPRRAVDPSTALSAIRDAIWVVRREPQGSRPLGQFDAIALAETRCAALVGPRTTHPISDVPADEVQRAHEELADSFTRQMQPHFPDADVERLVTEFVLYGMYLPDRALAWNPSDARVFMLGRAPDEVVLDDATAAALPALLENWVTACLRHRGVADTWIETVAEAVRSSTGEYVALYGDATSYGAAREVARLMADEALDVDEAVDAVRRQRQARRDRLASRPDVPTGFSFDVVIVLHGVQPRVWRRVRVPAGLTLDRMHRVLMAAMGWSGDHRHKWEGVYEDERRVRLWDVAREGDRLGYVYDLGDNWQHTLLVERLLPAVDGALPRLLDGSGAVPPEDIGGAPAYRQMVAALTGGSRTSALGRELAQTYPHFDVTYFPKDAVDECVRHA